MKPHSTLMGFISVGLAAAIQILLSGCGASSTDSGSLTAEHQSLKTEHESLKTVSQGLKDKYESLVAEHQSLKTEHESLKTVSQGFKDKYESLTAEHQSLKTEHESLKTVSQGFKDKYESLTAEHQSLKTERESLKTANQSLTKQVDDLKFGADRIIASVQLAYSKKSYADAKAGIKLLEEKHPQSPKNAEFSTLLKTIGQEELEVEQRRLAEEKEKHRLASLQNTGVWEMDEYIDKFKEKTGEKFLSHRETIKGTFSNSATEDSKLDVELLADLKGVSIQLYEYGRNLKKNSSSSSSNTFSIDIRDKNGGRHEFSGTMYAGAAQVSLDKKWTADFHAIMKKGGPIKFLIRNDSRRVESYFFTILQTDGYENALRMLTEKK